jgi:MFS superfamily sulfate permease-like transporter
MDFTVIKGGRRGRGGGVNNGNNEALVRGSAKINTVLRKSGPGAWMRVLFIVILVFTMEGTEAAFASAPTVVPSSLVAGAVGTATVSFTTGTDLPNDGKIVIEFPTSFAAVGSDTTSKFGVWDSICSQGPSFVRELRNWRRNDTLSEQF